MNRMDFNSYVFNISIIFIHISYLAVFFGIVYVDERYIRYFSTFIQLFVCLFLIIRFFPLNKTQETTKLDVSIIFYCATFLLMNVVSIEIYNILKQVGFDKIIQ
jgi:hypothetical protein